MRPSVVPDFGPGGCPSATLKPCSSHGTCIEGGCVCDRGFSGPDCAHREYLHACPLNCSSGECENGRCICPEGRSGDACEDITPVNCTADCFGHGDCVGGRCECKPGFYGPSCVSGCDGYMVASGAVCSGRGMCLPTGSPGHSVERCKCFVGFEGSGCEVDVKVRFASQYHLKSWRGVTTEVKASAQTSYRKRVARFRVAVN